MSWTKLLSLGRHQSHLLQERFDLVSSASGEGLWDMSVIAGDPVNPKNVFWWSNQFRALLGYRTVEEFPDVLDSWSSRLHPDDAQRVLTAFAAHLNDRTGRIGYDIEYRLKMRSGEYRWFRARGTTLRDAQQAPLRTAGSLADITDLKKREQEMDILLQRFKLVNDASDAGLWDMSVIAGDPVNPGNVFWWSDQFRKMLGYKNTSDFPDVLSSWSDLLHPEDKDRTLNAFGKHLMDKTGRIPYDIEYRLKVKTGQYRWFRARGTTLRGAQGVPLRVAGSLVDITGEKEMLLRVEEVAGNALAARDHLIEVSRGIAEDPLQHLRIANENANAISELILSLRDTAVNAAEAANASNQAGNTAREGGVAVNAAIAGMDQVSEVVTQASDSLSRLADSSHQIGQILGTIEGIADQTNMLALNAAIEAARAGEHGRGFAVVAEEVRRLAEQAAKSTQEITHMISSIQSDIKSALTSMEKGVIEVVEKRKLATKASEALDQIIQATLQVETSISMVAAGAEEQLAVSDMLNSATNGMRESAEKNAESVEAMQGAVSRIDNLTSELNRAILKQPATSSYHNAA